MLKVILNRQAKEIIVEEQTGFRAGRNTTKQIFNLRILCGKYLEHQLNLNLSCSLRQPCGNTTVRTTEQLYDKATSAILMNSSARERFKATILSPTLFNFFSRTDYNRCSGKHDRKVSIGSRNVSNLRFADDIDVLAEEQQELETLLGSLDKTCTKYKMETSTETRPRGYKTFFMLNSIEHEIFPAHKC